MAWKIEIAEAKVWFTPVGTKIDKETGEEKPIFVPRGVKITLTTGVVWTRSNRSEARCSDGQTRSIKEAERWSKDNESRTWVKRTLGVWSKMTPGKPITAAACRCGVLEDGRVRPTDARDQHDRPRRTGRTTRRSE